MHGEYKNFSNLTPSSLWKRQYSKTCVKRPPSKGRKIGFQDQLSLNAGQKYCKMLQGEHSAILLTFIQLPFVIKTFVMSILSGRFTQVLLYFSTILGAVSAATATISFIAFSPR